MSNVQRLILSASEEQEQHVVVQFTSQFLKLHHLRDLYLESPSSCQAAWTRCSGEERHHWLRNSENNTTMSSALSCCHSTLNCGNIATQMKIEEPMDEALGKRPNLGSHRLGFRICKAFEVFYFRRRDLCPDNLGKQAERVWGGPEHF